MSFPQIYCHKCKEKTDNIDAQKVQCNNGLWRIAAKCKICETKKSQFIKCEKCKTTKGHFSKSDNLVQDDRIKSDEQRKIEAEELHKQVKRKFKKRKINIYGINDSGSIDLVDMRTYQKENNGYKYMLNYINNFSKKAYSRALKKKNGIETSKAFESILKEVGYEIPKLLHVDKGLEFKNKQFTALMEKYGIKMYHTENREKSAIIERFNRTLNEKMKVKFEYNKSFKWIDMLQDLIKNYNNTVHSTIGMKPIEVNKNNEKYLLKSYKIYSQSKIKFKVGDRVRIITHKKTFDNKYRNNWSREIFMISEVQYTDPVTYRIENLNGKEVIGSFYQQELQISKG